MHVLWKATVLMAAATLGQAASAACYLVYAPDNTVVYRSFQPPVNLSMPLHTTLPQVAPGGHLVFALDPSGCEFEVNKLDKLQAMVKPVSAKSSKPARRSRGT